jgi:type II restriction enzyme
LERSCEQPYRQIGQLEFVPLKLGFEEETLPYDSPSQSARVWTETWVQRWFFCPHCGAEHVRRFENNRPVADFACEDCGEEFELKSQKKAFGTKVVDGAYRTMRERLASAQNPNLVLLNYDLARRSVTNLFVVPKHLFVPAIIQERKPLADTARRAGWVGCNILLDRIPDSGRVFIVRNGELIPPDIVRAQWRRTSFLREEPLDGRGWLIEVMRCVERIGRVEFRLDEVYAFEAELRRAYPANRHIRQKIRQQLQVLRDAGYLDFVGGGVYRLRRSA